MDKLDLFLASDVEAKGEVHLKRFGMDFEVKGFTDQEFRDIREQATYGSGKKKGEVNETELVNLIVAYGVVSPNLSDPKVMKKYGARDAADAVSKAFLVGELATLRDAILKLSGFDEEESIEEAKN